MKFLILFTLLVIFVGILEANKDEKESWKAKKAKHQLMLMKANQPKKVELSENVDYNLKEKSHKLKHYFGRKFFKNNKRAKKLRKYKKSRKTMQWLSLRSDIDCELQCLPGEVCVSTPINAEPICMHKKEFKKSLKFLRKYHKKDIKSWKKQLRKKFLKFTEKEEEKKYGKVDKDDDVEELKKKKMEWEKMDGHDMKTHKTGKHHKTRPKYAEPVCGRDEFGQMKNRMTAWFHLLHGQDKKARKAHGGSIKKFYKHVSVKKELREHNGEKCMCMKSAMWQFDQMDEDKDGQLSTKELAFMEQSSLEPCMRPYLQSCDKSGDKMINHDEWCCCFNHVLPPCFERVKQIKRSGLPASEMPRCDIEGYYMLEQCKGEAKDRVCWCVDQSGNEYDNTMKQGKAHCHKIDKFAYSQKQVAPML